VSPQIIQQPTAAADELQKPSPRMVILSMGLEMIGEIGDAIREYGNLNLG
jgi:hypothetical protein